MFGGASSGFPKYGVRSNRLKGVGSASSEGSYFEVAGEDDTEIRDFASHASLD